jgi:hypothetical protein
LLLDSKLNIRWLEFATRPLYLNKEAGGSNFAFINGKVPSLVMIDLVGDKPKVRTK